MKVQLIKKRDTLATIAFNIFDIALFNFAIMKPNVYFLLADEFGNIIQDFESYEEAMTYIKVYEYELL